MLSHYQIIEQIGCGATSVVYRAFDPKRQKQVAIKVLHPFVASKEDSLRRLVREAQTISKLHHAGILQIYDLSTTNDFFIVTELVEGLTLKEFGEKHQVWNTPEIGALIIREVALALQYAHGHHVVHRDIKSENIMISQDGALKLMDFGIARVRDQESLTLTGAMIGSPAHMAPEIIEGKASDFRADIFSLSTVFYWLATGEPPYEGDNPHTLLKNIVEGRYRAIEELSVKVLPSLQRVIEKGMATAARDRFQSAGEFAAAIDKALFGLNIDLSAERLAQTLACPDLEFSRFSEMVLEAALQKARMDSKKGDFPQAVIYLNRILADKPEHTEALALAEQHPVLQAAQTHKPRLWRLALAVAVAASVFAIWTFDQISPPLEKGGQGDLPRLQQEKNPPDPLFLSGDKKPNPMFKTVITVTPFADIWIDGQRVARNSSRVELHLSPGEHIALFKHEFAATEQRTFPVSSDRKSNHFHVVLERVKSASLIIRSNVEADIALDGNYKGTTSLSALRPILVTFPDRSHKRRLEIVVSQKGYMPYIATHTLIPGKKQIIDVKLVPEPS
jgi:hypothetical protein